MFLSAHSHMPIFSFILVDDDFMIQACKNNTSLTLELSAISKHVLVITHTHISRLLALELVTWISVFSFFLHGDYYILHPPTEAGIMYLRLRFETALLFSWWIKFTARIWESAKGGKKCSILLTTTFNLRKGKQFKKHLVIPYIIDVYSKTC